MDNLKTNWKTRARNKKCTLAHDQQSLSRSRQKESFNCVTFVFEFNFFYTHFFLHTQPGLKAIEASDPAIQLKAVNLFS